MGIFSVMGDDVASFSTFVTKVTIHFLRNVHGVAGVNVRIDAKSK